jgi:hypothetical protein
MIRNKPTTLLVVLGSALLLPAYSATAASPGEHTAITRGQFIKQITDKLQLAPMNIQTTLPSDVSTESPYADAVRVMRERQILQGYSDGTFRLNQPVSRTEAAFILGRFLGLSDSQASSKLQADFGVDFGNEEGLNSSIAGAVIKQALANDSDIGTWLADDSTTKTELKTFRAHMDMKMNINFKPDAGYNTDSIQTEASSDIAYNAEQGIHQSVTTTAPGSDTLTRTVKMEQYTLSQGTFMSTPNGSNTGFVWLDMSKHTPFTFDQLMALQKKSIEMNKSLVTPYFFYKDLGSSEEAGKKQRKISIHGKLTNSADIMKTLGGIGGNQDMFKDILNSPAIAGMSVSLSTVLTLDEQTRLPIRMNSDYIIAYGEDPKNPIDHLDISMSIIYKDPNQPVDIVLPEEAKQAKPFPMPAE